MSSFYGAIPQNKDRLKPVYFFHGEEAFPAFQFIHDIQLSPPEDKSDEIRVEKYDLRTDSWADIIDSARTLPLLSSLFRLIQVEIPSRKKQYTPGKEEQLSPSEQEMLKSYLASPSEKTVLIIIFNQKTKKTFPLLKLFQSVPKDSVCIIRLDSLKGKKLYSWIREQVQKQGKTMDYHANAKLVEFAGNDLRRLSNEITKLATFTGKQNRIRVQDVELISGWIKPFIKWEITNDLEEADFQKCVFTLNKLIEKENIHPVVIMDEISGFFNDILLAKLRLIQGEKDKKSIFKEIKPFIPERFKDLYNRKFVQIIDFAEKIPVRELRYYLEQLKEIDLKIKTTGLSFQDLMDGFLFDYCKKRAGQR
ncbi:MAG: DNA polymerase III subunit delta [Candidatus Aminicenantes bacterium]|nr:DNA polymerase III subunit delta [Candidatus Aminicenantes bacterium]